MTTEYLREVKAGLKSPFWQYLQQQIALEVAELRKEASRFNIQQMTDFAIREQMLMRANALEDFFDQLPTKIDERYKATLESETK